jgi:mannose-6-phosphate isomerase class I
MSQQKQNRSFILLTPLLIEKPWGSLKLGQKFLQKPSSKKIGEAWLCSDLPTQGTEQGSTLAEGKTLEARISAGEISDWKEKGCPFVVKLIETTDHLSIQVHPTADYARSNHKVAPKDECWFILESEKEAGIYLGLKPSVTREEFLNGSDVSHLMNFYPVKRGDFFSVPAGAVHAIGKGITLLEVQQRSGTTFRVWDWNRVDENGKGRTLHIQEALEVINFEASFNAQWERAKNKKNQSDDKEYQDLAHGQMQKLISHPDFTFSAQYFLKDQNYLPGASSGSCHERPEYLFLYEGKGKIQEAELPPLSGILWPSGLQPMRDEKMNLSFSSGSLVFTVH